MTKGCFIFWSKTIKKFKDLNWVLLQESLGQIHTLLMSVFLGIYINYMNREQREYDSEND